MRHKRYSCVRFREWKWSSSHFVVHTCCTYVLVKLVGMRQQLGLQLLQFPVDPPSGSPAAGVCLALRGRAPVSPAVYTYHQEQRQQKLIWVSVHSPGFQLMLVGSSLSLLSPNWYLLPLPDYLTYRLQTPESHTRITALPSNLPSAIVGDHPPVILLLWQTLD